MADTAPIVQRPLLMDAGEPLLIASSPIESAVRFGQWLEVSGLPPEATTVSGLIAVPVPSYPRAWPEGRNRWDGTRPEIMWHPFMWLPERVAHRYTIVEPDTGNERLEDDDEWCTRVALEVTAAGLYDETNGGWIDVLALAGLDIASPDVLARVERWLSGAADEVLDHIDIGPLLEVEPDPDWGGAAAAGWIDSLRVVAWAKQANELIAYALNLEEIAPQRPDEVDDLKWACGHIARLAQVSFRGTSEVDDEDFPDDGYWWAKADESDTYEGEVRGLVDGVLADLIENLQTVRDRYWPEMEDIIESVPEEPSIADEIGTGGPVPEFAQPSEVVP